MRKQNPFPFSNDNKRYQTWNYYLKETYRSKVYKVPINMGFGCPNRDGTKALGGCTFCSALGSGDYAGNMLDSPLTQYEQGKKMMERKWPNSLTIPYFQAYTNTYAPLTEIIAMIEPFLELEEVVAIAIATRADCLSNECLDYLSKCSLKKEIWLELGLQTIHDHIAIQINRGHTYFEFIECLERCKSTPLKICVHLMNGLPNETKEMMLESAQTVAKLPIHSLKIHMLHVIKDTALANQTFPLLTKEEYVELVVKQLEVLPHNIIIQRLTGDAVASDLIAPEWTLNKTSVLNEIDKLMARKNTWQGKKYE